MKLYNAKLGRVIDGTPMMAKLLAIKGWIVVTDEEPATAQINELPDSMLLDIEGDKPYPYEDIKEDFNDKPKADPVKVKAKTKTKK